MKFKHLQAWDIMMGSFQYYIEMQQELAEKENAPIDCIYKGSNGVWSTFSEIKSESTKNQILNIVQSIDRTCV